MPREEPLLARMVLVFSSRSIPEGHLVKGLLQADGIPVEVRGESEGPYRMGPIDLWVPKAFEVQARLLIEEAASAGIDEPEDDLDEEGAEEPGTPEG